MSNIYIKYIQNGCFSFYSPADLQTLPQANENKFWVKLWKDHFHTTPVTFWAEGFDKL